MIKLGPAGTPHGSTLEGVSEVKRLGLDAMEVEFVRGVKMSNSTAKQIGILAKNLDIELSVHAPYYINLASEDKAKAKASKQRILQSCERAHYLGAKNVVFHAAYYGKYSEQECYEIVKKELADMQETIKKNGWDVSLSPETTGKGSQFGTVDELIKLVKEIKCSVCVDFAHILARNNGKINYKEVFDKIDFLKHIHAHFSGIEYTSKGEKRHLVMTEQDFLPLAREIKERNANITIICESPITWQDSLKMKEILKELG